MTVSEILNIPREYGSALHGVYPMMPAEEYHSGPGVSKSMLDDIAPPYAPLHFHAKHVAKTVEREETPAMRIGSLAHRYILEPDSLSEVCAAPEGMDFRTTVGKAWKVEHAGREIVSAAEYKALVGMRDAVWSHPMAMRLLEGAETEVSLYDTDADGILRRARLDGLNGYNSIPDVKTVQSCDLEEVEKSIANYRYHVQGAYYVDLCNLLGIEKQTFVLICVEKTAPHDVVCYEINRDAMDFGRQAYRRDLALLNYCRENNSWPGRSEEIQSAGLPAWMLKKF